MKRKRESILGKLSVKVVKMIKINWSNLIYSFFSIYIAVQKFMSLQASNASRSLQIEIQDILRVSQIAVNFVKVCYVSLVL